MTNQSCNPVEGIIDNSIKGTREEIWELKDLLDEVLDGVYAGNMRAFKSDLIPIVNDNMCDDCDSVNCPGLIEAVEAWAEQRMRALQNVDDFLEMVDIEEVVPGEENGLPGQDDWSNDCLTEKSGLELVKQSHCEVDPSLDEKPARRSY